MEHFIVPPFERRTVIPVGYLPGGAFAKSFINNGGSQKGVNPFSVFFTPAVKAVKEKKDAPHLWP